MPDFVRLTNNGRKPFDFHQNNVKQIIPPGGDKIVPWSMATSLFGNPGVINVPPENARRSIFNKVRARLNYQLGLMTDEQWDEVKPNVVVTDLDSGERVYMILDDPEGEHLADATPVPTNAQSDVQLLQNQVAALTAQIGQLINAQMAAPADAASGTTQSATAVTDSPGAPITPEATSDNPPAGPSAAQAPDVGDVNADGPDGIDAAFGLTMPTIEAQPSEDTPGAIPVGVSEPPPPAPAPDPAPAAAPVKKAAAKKAAPRPK